MLKNSEVVNIII